MFIVNCERCRVARHTEGVCWLGVTVDADWMVKPGGSLIVRDDMETISQVDSIVMGGGSLLLCASGVLGHLANNRHGPFVLYSLSFHCISMCVWINSSPEVYFLSPEEYIRNNLGSVIIMQALAHI